MGRPRLIWRGEVYNVDLGPPVGHEPASVRPVVVISTDVMNNGPGGVLIVVPVTSTAYGLRSHVEVETGSSGLDHTSYARCDQLRVVSVKRLGSRRGALDVEQIQAVDTALRFVLDL